MASRAPDQLELDFVDYVIPCFNLLRVLEAQVIGHPSPTALLKGEKKRFAYQTSTAGGSNG